MKFMSTKGFIKLLREYLVYLQTQEKKHRRTYINIYKLNISRLYYVINNTAVTFLSNRLLSTSESPFFLL